PRRLCKRITLAPENQINQAIVQWALRHPFADHRHLRRKTVKIGEVIVAEAFRIASLTQVIPFGRAREMIQIVSDDVAVMPSFAQNGRVDIRILRDVRDVEDLQSRLNLVGILADRDTMVFVAEREAGSGKRVLSLFSRQGLGGMITELRALLTQNHMTPTYKRVEDGRTRAACADHREAIAHVMVFVKINRVRNIRQNP